MHLRFAAAAPECLVMKEPDSVMRAGYIKSKKIVFHKRLPAHEKLRYELAARIARTFANFAAKAIASSGKFKTVQREQMNPEKKTRVVFASAGLVNQERIFRVFEQHVR
jgi:hypothetical protein